MLMYEDFKASAQRVEDIAQHIGYDDGLPVHGGFIFDGGCYIEDNAVGDPEFIAKGKYYLLIERADWVSDDLDFLSKILWAFHYVFETPEVVALRGRDLDYFIEGFCAGAGAVVRPGVFRNAFSARSSFTPREAADIIAASLYG